MASVPVLPRVDRFAARAGRGLFRAVTPRTGEPSGVPRPQSVRSYVGEQARAFDPRSPAGALNLAATLFPGAGKGGRLSPLQALLLKQLGNVKTTKVIRHAQHPFTGDRIGARYEAQHADQPIIVEGPEGRSKAFTEIPELLAILNDEMRPLMDRLGYTRGSAGNLLLELVSRRPVDPKYERSREARLGTQGPGDFRLGPGATPWTYKDARITPPVNPHSQRIIDLLAESARRRRDHPYPR